MSSVSNLHLSGVDPALKIIIFVLMVAHVAALVRASASRRGSGCARAHVRNQASPPWHSSNEWLTLIASRVLAQMFWICSVMQPKKFKES